MPEAQLENFGSGLTPVTQGWFVVNVRDAGWWFAEKRGARCAFENDYGDPPVEFSQLGINECALIVEDEEQRLRPWDFFHAPRGPSTPSWGRARGRA